MTTEPKMRAIVQDSYGTDQVLESSVIERPTIEEDEVLIQVHSAGLDRGTWHLMAGEPYLMRLAFGVRRPRKRVPGLDVSGTVVAVGGAVTRFQEGDQVLGIAKGSFAEFAAAKEAKLVTKPTDLAFDQAAALPVSGLTAIQALVDVGGVAKGQHVLILGASGGVGTYAVQMAKACGAEVTGVCSGPKADLVRSLGADHVIDYTTEDFAAGAARYDLILDIGGNPSLARLRSALTRRGTAVIVGGEGGGRWTGGIDRQFRAKMMSPFVSQKLTFFVSKETHVDLERVLEFVAAGELSPALDRTYPLDRAPDAMRQLESGQVAGKVVISVAGSIS